MVENFDLRTSLKIFDGSANAGRPHNQMRLTDMKLPSLFIPPQKCGIILQIITCYNFLGLFHLYITTKFYREAKFSLLKSIPSLQNIKTKLRTFLCACSKCRTLKSSSPKLYQSRHIYVSYSLQLVKRLDQIIFFKNRFFYIQQNRIRVYNYTKLILVC